MSLTYIKAACHCGLNTFQIPLLTSSLPQSNHLCHCNSCRHVSGQLALHSAAVEGIPLAADSGLTPDTHKAASLDNLEMYAVSDDLKRYFCKKCASHMLLDYKDFWSVSSGVLEKTDGVVKVGCHQWIGDTLDGGLADHYRALEGKELLRYEVEDDQDKFLPAGWKAERIAAKNASTTDKEDKLSVYCHCKTISLEVTRYKDQASAKDPAKWWLVPANEDDPSSPGVRYIAGYCFCSSCRLTCGALFSSFILLPRANVFDAHASTGKPIELAIPTDGSTNPNRPKGLKQNESSPGTFRESCGTCGASVFYWSKAAEGKHLPKHEGVETEVINISAGLVDQEDSGARGERWISWYDQLIRPEEALDKPGMEAIQASVKLTQEKFDAVTPGEAPAASS